MASLLSNCMERLTVVRDTAAELYTYATSSNSTTPIPTTTVKIDKTAIDTFKANLALEELDYCPIYGKIMIALVGLEDKFQRIYYKNAKPDFKIAISSSGYISIDWKGQSKIIDVVTSAIRTLSPGVSRIQLNLLTKHTIKAFKWLPLSLHPSMITISQYEMNGLDSLYETYKPIAYSKVIEDATGTRIRDNKSLIKQVIESPPEGSLAFIDIQDTLNFPLSDDRIERDITRDQFMAKRIQKLWPNENLDHVAGLLTIMNNVLDRIEKENSPIEKESFANRFKITKTSLESYLQYYPLTFQGIKEEINKIDQARIARLEKGEAVTT